ncbi:MAG: hypothetical protein COZ08_13150 [Bacteroidetes bacterium CG_4_10_14_3_um_filter_42_6]|nr:MAG: hypothetical protein COZ08_13150 [Bacteroidetes bacterium CG_4_10_14_3_um_filter_42_6]
MYNPNDTSSNPFYKTTYSSQVKGDTICIDIPGVPIKIINMNNSLILISYKTIKYLPNNIDEVLQLDDNFHILNKSGVKGRFKKDLFIVPEHFEGICAVAYQQPDGILPDIDSSGNNVFIFDPDCMLLSVKTTEDIYNIACNNIQFYYRDSHGKLREIKVIRSYFTDNPVDYSAINLGLNQFGRGILNQIVGDSISGNILFFYIGNSQHDLSHPDSLLFNGKYYMLEYSN